MPACLVFAAVSLALLSVPAGAEGELDRMQLATALGDLLAAESGCGLTYNQDAIKKFIDSKVPADDLQFSGYLSLSVSGSSYTLKEMSASTKVAHCRQIERGAKSYGFI